MVNLLKLLPTLHIFFSNRDFNSLSPHDVKGNCKKAFDAGDTLGIPRVIEPSDMDMLAGESLSFCVLMCLYFHDSSS